MTRRALREKWRKQSPSEPVETTDSSRTAKGTKCIINISSLYATKGGIGVSTYAATKAGIIALTRAIAAEGSLGASGATIRANVIVPGYVETKMLDGISKSLRSQLRIVELT
jgi:NAD(P)-dependent dehydrogenase (short-subunit alcohol dehydrogenase family)